MQDRDPQAPQAGEPVNEPASREPVFNIASIIVVIIVVCAGIHLFRQYALDPQSDFELLLRAAFIPARYSADGGMDIYAVTSPVTYSLFHVDVLHLAINMIWLAAFGSPLANRIGAPRLVGFWIFTSVAAVLVHYLAHMNEAVLVIGASGAVSGMMAAAARFGFRIDRTMRKPAFSGRRLTISGILRNRTVVVFLAVWFAVNLIAGMGFLVPGEARTIAWEAHIGGFVAGFFGLAIFDRRSRAQRAG